MKSKKDILGYASKIWSTADTLRGVGIKDSDFPAYMMPFFALMLVESRIVRTQKEKEAEGELDFEDILEEIQEEGKGYNEVVLKDRKTLKDICSNDKSFEQDFHHYLQAFDNETKELLGINYTEGEKYLDLKGFSESLKANKVLYSFVKDWASIDLTDFDNSDVTTLEEHIKRKWSDISAETAGQQYTPDDIIDLIEDIVIDRFSNVKDKILNVYDMTCGGGNMLFGVADGIEEKTKGVTVNTYGQELNSQLYALAKIESRFRHGSHIARGNTLTTDKFTGTGMDIGVANPPYGVDWKNVQKDILNDKTGRYEAGTPSVSDGQLLFVQHQISKIKERKGQSFIVLNGSPLFSGDAGSGESEIRKWILDNDYLEALIQLPQGEFFNTPITTYLWVINLDKPKERKDKICLINAEKMYKKMKKNKGDKNKEIDPESREQICKLLKEYKETNDSKIMSKYDFYYNKQKLEILNVDNNGRSVREWFKEGKDKILFKDLEFMFDGKISTILETQPILTSELIEDQNKFKEASKQFKEALKQEEKYEFYKDGKVVVSINNGIVEYDGKKAKGILDFNWKYNKKTKTANLEVLIKADIEKDAETIPYSPSEKENELNIKEFIRQWVSRESKLLDNTIGTEINFNKVFYKPEKLRSKEEIEKRLSELRKESFDLEKELFQ